jgi:hypothetical protein
MGLALRLVGVRPVYSCVRAEPAEPAEQGFGALLRREWTRPQDIEDGKKDS